MDDDRNWFHLHEVATEYGYSSLASAQAAVRGGTFPVPTYKLGRRIVVDVDVHAAFFRRKRQEGLQELVRREATHG